MYKERKWGNIYLCFVNLFKKQTNKQTNRIVGLQLLTDELGKVGILAVEVLTVDYGMQFRKRSSATPRLNISNCKYPQ